MAGDDMTHIEAQPCWPPWHEPQVFECFILLTANATQDDGFYACLEQVGQFVCDGLTSCPPVHIEAVGQDQPALLGITRHFIYKYFC